MAQDDDEKSRSHLKVVSDNPDLPDRAQRQAKEDGEFAMRIAEQALQELAVTVLRTMAGSTEASYEIIRRINDYVDAHNRLYTQTGRGMTVFDEQRVLRLESPDWSSGADGYQIKRAMIDDARHTIVQGALRLAAHMVRGEPPAFGGMHSTQLIEDGIRSLKEAREWRPTPPPRIDLGPRSKKAPPPAADKAGPTGLALKQRPMLKDPTGGKSKRWSPMDSKSWRDVKNDQE